MCVWIAYISFALFIVVNFFLTRWVAGAFEIRAAQQRTAWTNGTWDKGEANPALLTELRTRSDAYMAFLLEHTGLSRRTVQTVLDANDAYWDRIVERWGYEQAAHWAQGEPWDDDEDPSNAG